MKNKLSFGKTVFALAMMICLTNAFAATAHADEYRDHEYRDHEWRQHEREAREWHHRHYRHDYDRPVVFEQPNVVYAPPVIVQAPPVEEAESSGFNVTIPINFR